MSNARHDLYSFAEREKDLLRKILQGKEAQQQTAVGSVADQAAAGETGKAPGSKSDVGKTLQDLAGMLPRVLQGSEKVAPANIAASTVFSAEMQEISTRRSANGRPLPTKLEPSVSNDLTGIALSGGGVRSAAFCLGALQALFHVAGKSKADARSEPGKEPPPPSSDLACIDYLSTVSGGGYIGTCLSLGMTRTNGRFPFGDPRQEAGETPVLQHLRDNSRYLLHGGVGGIFSFLLIYLRGVIAGLLCLAPVCLAFAGALLLWLNDLKGLDAPPFFNWFGSYNTSYLPVSTLIAGLVAAYLAVSAVYLTYMRPANVTVRRSRAARSVWLIVPLLAAVVVELHVALLRSYLVSSFVIPGPNVPASDSRLIKIEALVDWVNFLIPGLVALVVAALPFIQKLALAATSKQDAGKSGVVSAALSRALLVILAAVMPVVIWLGVMALVLTGLNSGCGRMWGAGLLAVAAILLAIGLWGIDINANSLHQIYRDRMSRAFLISEDVLEMAEGSARTKALDEIDATRLSTLQSASAPYHILNTTLNLPGSAWANRRGRNAEFFMYSPLFVGSALTGYVSTKAAEDTARTFNLGSAMAVSGAAVAPNMGMGTVAPLSFTLALLNLRLGRWAMNPRQLNQMAQDKDRWTALDRWPDMRHFFYEALSKTGFKLRPAPTPNSDAEVVTHSGGDDAYIFLSDGGHIENLGVYELLRRRCRLIIAVDGECDPEVRCQALAQLERMARIDLGVRLRFDTAPITRAHRRANEAMTDDTKPFLATEHKKGPHVAAVLIEYPSDHGSSVPKYGTLLYVKSSLSGDENAYIAAYKRKHPSFPHETTGDQFFTEEQFEVYRALGEHILRRALLGQDPVCSKQAELSAAEKAGLTQALGLLPGQRIALDYLPDGETANPTKTPPSQKPKRQRALT